MLNIKPLFRPQYWGRVTVCKEVTRNTSHNFSTLPSGSVALAMQNPVDSGFF